MSRALQAYAGQLVTDTPAGPVWKLKEKQGLNIPELNGFKCE